MTLANICLCLNVLCVVLLAGRCWVLESRTAPAPATDAAAFDARRTKVWRLRKPTVFHRRRG